MERDEEEKDMERLHHTFAANVRFLIKEKGQKICGGSDKLKK